MEQWCPFAQREPGVSPGPFVGGGAPKSLLHTTEGGGYAGALSVFRARGFWPTATASFETGHFQLWQHLPLNLAAAALEHRPGTGETNRDCVVQLEIVGSADPDYARQNRLLYVGDFPAEYLAGIARWLRFVADNTGAPLVAPLPFGPIGTVARAPWALWHTTGGVYGHCHVPANSHTDPGAIDITTLLALAHGDSPMGPIVTLPANIVREYRRQRGGRWKVGSDGGIFADEGAPFFGSMGGTKMNAPVVALVPTDDEGGYWLIGADGGIFAFGDARPIAPYLPLVTEYHVGARHIVDAVPNGNGIEMVSNLGENYVLT